MENVQQYLVWGVECPKCETPIMPIGSWDRSFVCLWCHAALPAPKIFKYVMVQCGLCQEWSILAQKLVEEYICSCQLRKKAADVKQQVLFLNRYKLIEVLGKGAVGEVWKAVENSSSREVVAIKFIEGAGNQLARAKREAMALIHLSHRGIIPIYGYFRGAGIARMEKGKPVLDFAGESISLVMKYVSGGNLEEWSKNFFSAPESVAELFIKIYDALDVIHRAGIVHRDLKPQNILMEDNQPIIADFGLSRPVDATSITAIGTIMGSIDYMSPEQARGRKAETRSDLYATGAIIWKLLFGKPIFSGNSPLVQFRKIARDPIPEIIERLPVEFQGILGRLLTKNPEMRFQSALEVQKAMRKYLQEAKNTGRSTKKTQVRIPRIHRPVTRPRLRKMTRKRAKYVKKKTQMIAWIFSIILLAVVLSMLVYFIV